MNNVAEKKRKALEGSQTPEGVWIQIVFTLSMKHYKELRKYAEDARTNVPSVVREKVLDFLKDLKVRSPQSLPSPKDKSGGGT